MKKPVAKKPILNLVYVFTYKFKTPKLPENLNPADFTEEENAKLKALTENANKGRFVTMVTAPFENIEAKPQYLIDEALLVGKKLRMNLPVKDENQLVKFFWHLLGEQKERENIVLKDCFVINTNDFTEMQIVN